MKRLRTLMSLVAICGMAAFFTGCGGDNNNDNTQPASNAPASLNGNTYALTDAGGSGSGSTLTFDQNANTYTWNHGGTIETGTFTATRNTSNGDIWDVVVIDSGGQPQSNLRLTFGANNTGSFLFQRPGSADVTGTFTLSTGNGSTTTTGTNTGTTTNTGSNTGTTTNTGTDTGTTTNTGTNTGTTTTTGTDTGTTTNTGTNTGTTTTTGTDTGTTTNTGTNTGTTTTTGTDTGTTTNTGTNTGTTTNTGTDTGTTTSTGTNSGTTTGGTVQAPAQISSISVHTTTSVLEPTSYTVNFSGGSSGTFQITGNSTGNGNYTYQANGTTAHLVLTYTGDYQGDYDDMTLIFQGPPGTTEDSHFTGTQKVDQTTGNLAGTFSYLVP